LEYLDLGLMLQKILPKIFCPSLEYLDLFLGMLEVLAHRDCQKRKYWERHSPNVILKNEFNLYFCLIKCQNLALIICAYAELMFTRKCVDFKYKIINNAFKQKLPQFRKIATTLGHMSVF
jgi:hypothetical protein